MGLQADTAVKLSQIFTKQIDNTNSEQLEAAATQERLFLEQFKTEEEVLQSLKEMEK